LKPINIICRLKNHFTNPKYDFFKYGAKTRASVTSLTIRGKISTGSKKLRVSILIKKS
jgi:hypothetical protein